MSRSKIQNYIRSSLQYFIIFHFSKDSLRETIRLKSYPVKLTSNPRITGIFNIKREVQPRIIIDTNHSSEGKGLEDRWSGR